MSDTQTMFLTGEELAALTHRQRSPSQGKVLNFMGIEHRRRPDGSIPVPPTTQKLNEFNSLRFGKCLAKMKNSRS